MRNTLMVGLVAALVAGTGTAASARDYGGWTNPSWPSGNFCAIKVSRVSQAADKQPIQLQILNTSANRLRFTIEVMLVVASKRPGTTVYGEKQHVVVDSMNPNESAQKATSRGYDSLGVSVRLRMTQCSIAG